MVPVPGRPGGLYKPDAAGSAPAGGGSGVDGVILQGHRGTCEWSRAARQGDLRQARLCEKPVSTKAIFTSETEITASKQT
ncbi:hypothetical protein [Arthrobacter sp. MA-N2]|uniref:hypothetical protein n=1 Tax=Arthrobacter sp. MA-N2 TaxID=1101188 RepID=UPI000484602C|nr:hypothetical protein [Arthrobacter sp. MA-N2]